jgi:Ca-activated chloride channel family protein
VSPERKFRTAQSEGQAMAARFEHRPSPTELRAGFRHSLPRIVTDLARRCTFRGRIVLAALFTSACASAAVSAQPSAPSDQEIAQAIARGVEFLKSAQSPEGSWDEPAQQNHRLGMTALAGLALLENGASIDDSAMAKTHRIVETLARESDQTYDLSLAILFLARLQQGRRGPADSLIQTLAHHLAAGGQEGMWTYQVPLDNRDRPPSESRADRPKRQRERRKAARRFAMFGSNGDNSNTQFALLGLWAASRHGFDSDSGLESIDDHFRSSQLDDGRWGYRLGMGGTNAMTCAGLMGLAIAAARPSLAERLTAKARGAALAADPAFVAALQAVGQDARQSGVHSDIYYLWSLERLCVALGLRNLDGFDWYAHGASILLARQQDDGGWPYDHWGRLPSTSLALLFLRKANLAFEIDRVLRLGNPQERRRVVPASARSAEMPAGDESPGADPIDTNQPPAETPGEIGADDVRVIVTGASQQAFPKISVQFEVKRPDGSFLLDGAKDDFRVAEEGHEVKVVDFAAPRATEAIATTVVLVVDHSLSMEEENRIGGLKRAVASFLEKLPEGSRIALIAFGSEVDPLCAFTTDRAQVKTAVDALQPAGATRFYDAVAAGLEMLKQETGRRAVLAMTDGEDTFSQTASLDSVIAAARKLGLPVYTLGLGSEDEIQSDDLRKLAISTRGQYYPARSADQLRAIYEAIAERLGSSYTLVYESDRKLPDGTLRPVRISYRGSTKSVGETAVFIPGMVVPAGGWPVLFLVLAAALATLAVLPGRLADRWTNNLRSGGGHGGPPH